MSKIIFKINGKQYQADGKYGPEVSLNDFIRTVADLRGTKVMCHEGGCGSCIVAVRARRQPSGRVELFSVNSCLPLVYSCNGWDITTIEGLGDRRQGYNDIQKRISAFNATQCGYCTPGWAMHLYSLQDKNLTMEKMEKAFACNTCRCTGFRPIMDTVKSFAVDASPDLCQKVMEIEELNICAKTKNPCERKCSVKSIESDWSLILDDSPKLEAHKTCEKTIEMTKEDHKFFKVYDEEAIFNILHENGVDSYMFIDGNTGKGVLENFELPRLLIDISSVKSLKVYSFDQNLIFGANISLEDGIGIFKDIASTRNEFAYLAEFVKHLELVAHMPVRKLGSFAGNLMLKHAMPSYPSDIYLLLLTVGAAVTVRNARCEKTVLTMEEFLEYDMTGMLIIHIELPPLSPSHTFGSYKIMPRHQNALAIVNAGFLISKSPRTNVISDARIVFGNISPDFKRATRTENYLKGQNVFKNEVLKGAIHILSEEVKTVDMPPQPSKECRKKLAIGLFYKFVLSIIPPNQMSSCYRSGGTLIPRPVSKGTQDFQTDESLYPLNQPVPKLEGMIQSAGEAQFANDIPPIPKEVFGAFIQSTVHSGQVDSIDVNKILETEGVIAVFTVKDIPGKNSFIKPGFPLQTEDEEIFATDIKYYGQPIAVLVAETEELAAKAAKKVEVTYKNVGSAPPVLTIDQAKKDSKRYAGYPDSIEPTGKGDDVTKVIKGVYEIEAQYHYYIEPITSVVVPVDDKLEVYDSTQWMDLTQIAIAQSLGEKESNIFIRCRRVGGGFGGKISRNVQASTACALIARKLNRPARFILPVQTNLTTAGRRLPCQCEYEVGVNDAGKIQYLNATIVEDDGCTHNENVLTFTVGGFPNCYDKQYFNVKTAAVLTDLPSNTFARAPGTSEAIACIENIMEHIALTLNKDSTEVRLINMRTTDNDLPALIEDMKKDTDYDKRAKEIEQFNKANRWMKKALQISVMSFPVTFFGNYSSMVTIYKGDGTVTVTTGGVEMGQGVNTKVAQVCAYELGVPLEYVSILPHFSFSSANNVFSGSSITSECACYATIQACKMLNIRLEPIKDSLTNPTWPEIAAKAGDEQIDLTAIYMMTDKEEELSSYNAFAVVAMEVQLDVLTGRFEMLRTDILEDVGLSANPNLDVGQVEGGFIQGIGYFTTEKLVYDQTTGKLLTNRSLTYHVPLALDIPACFNVKLRYNSKNPKGVLGSKAVGEMGICTAHSIMHALRQCIYASRKDSGYDTTEWINIAVPYDTESILKALDVKLDEMVVTK
uniref:Aldehyde oxidase n=1 Tax=Glyphodes pyloalis TaxID=1242752 RepID=A0A6M3GX80_GLYPY|nr:aldehyde oxidase [Glyphodes pyloalis]